MKKKSLLIIVAMLSIFLVAVSTAHARLSAYDAVPGEDILVPIICEGTLDGQNNPIFGSLNTNIAIAEVYGMSPLSAPYANYVSIADMTVWDYKSKFIYDDLRFWTPYDVVVDNCKDIVLDAPASKRAQMRIDMPKQDGTLTNLFAGYVIYGQIAGFGNRYIGWGYLIDLQKGFASGFLPIPAENGLGAQMGEQGDNRPVTAGAVMPRFFLLNGLADTWNWWILLMGRNELSEVNAFQFQSTRILTGIVCDEEELCRSITIEIPWELNLIDVLDILPNDIKTACDFPTNECGGFAILGILEGGTSLIPAAQTFTLLGSYNDGLPIVSPPTWYSVYGWSYQRAADSSATLSWDVMHEMHRLYCQDGMYTGVAQGDGNAVACGCTGAACTSVAP